MASRLFLLVGIDTEGDNQWEAAARANQQFENIYALPALHELFARHGIRPTYVVTHPVASDHRSADVLARLLERRDCEIGAHHHAWETPPFSAGDAARHPYASTLSRAQFEAQLASLTSAIAGAVGRSPVSYRSGRFGFSAAHVAALEREGYLVESSVAPLFYERHKGGPEFVDAPVEPYFLAYDSAVSPGSSNVLEVPVSAALNRRLPQMLARAWARAPMNYRTKRLLRAARLVRMRWLRPSYSSLEEMQGLARDLVRADVPVLNLLFHSSEAIVGGSPYNRTQAELDAFRARLERFLAYATKDLGASPATFAEFRAAWSSSS
jgi:peptidoglycan/xylan/chitin deacetylase (PgdA/CDA1 family)